MTPRIRVFLNSFTAAVLAASAGIQFGLGNDGNACLFGLASLLYVWIACAWAGK